MRANRSTTYRKSAIALAIAILALTAGAALAAIPSTTSYLYSATPVISGKVLWVNEHQLCVETEQGEEVVLALDSRSMVPVDLGPGMVMRAEFNVMDDGRKYAKRIVPIRNGMSAKRELAYSHEREDAGTAAQYVSTTDGGGPENGPGTASTALSSTNQAWGTSLVAAPSTEAHLVAMQPMIAGRVVTVNDHRIVVDTDQGQRVALEMDSRTIVPTDLASDMTVRVDYKTLTNGAKYARRITSTRSSTSREVTYVPSHERHEMMAQSAAVGAPTTTREPENPPQAMSEEPESPPQTESEEAESLPQTASRQPLIALLGFLALGAAGVVTIARRLHAS